MRCPAGRTQAAGHPASCPPSCENGAEGRAGELETQARRQVVQALVSSLEPIVARISELTIEIRHALQAHPDEATFRSLFIAHDSWLCAATMLSPPADFAQYGQTIFTVQNFEPPAPRARG
jgi:hypothetical protein